MKYLGIIGVSLFLSGSGAFAAAAANCTTIVSDLKEMQKAQESISGTLVSNHDIFASTLEGYASTLNTSASLGQPVTKEAVASMGDSAKSFRTRGHNAADLNKRLNQASNEVISRAIECLKAKKN